MQRKKKKEFVVMIFFKVKVDVPLTHYYIHLYYLRSESMQLRGEYHTQKSQDGSLVLLAGGKNIRSVTPLVLQTTTEQEKGSLLSDVYDKGIFILMFSVLFSFVVSSRFVRSRAANDSSVNDTKNELEDNSSSRKIEGGRHRKCHLE